MGGCFRVTPKIIILFKCLLRIEIIQQRFYQLVVPYYKLYTLSFSVVGVTAILNNFLRPTYLNYMDIYFGKFVFILMSIVDVTNKNDNIVVFSSPRIICFIVYVQYKIRCMNRKLDNSTIFVLLLMMMMSTTSLLPISHICNFWMKELQHFSMRSSEVKIVYINYIV